MGSDSIDTDGLKLVPSRFSILAKGIQCFTFKGFSSNKFITQRPEQSVFGNFHIQSNAGVGLEE